MKPVRWGILGAAQFAQNHMGPAIHAALGAELVALATASPEKAVGFQAFCPNLHVHSSYEALLADRSIDAVYLPLPNHLHLDWALKAVAAGKHVLVEKPAALQAEQVDQLIAARDRSGLLVAEAFMILHHPQWILARDWLQSGQIGALIHADAVFSYRNLDAANIRNRPETGGGSLRDIGVYTFGALRYVTGAEPRQLEARLQRQNGVDTFAHVFGTMGATNMAAENMAAGGGDFTFASTTSMRAYNRQVVTFQGTDGMIRLEGGCFNANVNDLSAVELHQGGNRVLVERFPAVNHYVLQVENFCRSIRQGAPWACPLKFSRGSQAMMDDAFAKAAEFGRPA